MANKEVFEAIDLQAILPKNMTLFYMPYCASYAHVNNDKVKAMMNAISAIKCNEDEVEYWCLRRFASNNWLKMHGYPMRRKGH